MGLHFQISISKFFSHRLRKYIDLSKFVKTQIHFCFRVLTSKLHKVLDEGSIHSMNFILGVRVKKIIARYHTGCAWSKLNWSSYLFET